MSTRCQIRFKNEDRPIGELAQVYIHRDGLPSNILPHLKKTKELCKMTNCGSEPSYIASNFIFLTKLVSMRLYFEERPYRDHINVVEPEELTVPENLMIDGASYLNGQGVALPSNGIHGDEEFLYIVETKRGDNGVKWHVKVSVRNGFPKWDGDTENAFEKSSWDFEGDLDEALKHYSENR